MSKNSQIVEIKSLIMTIALDIVIVERQSYKSDNVIRTELADSQSYLKNYKTPSLDDFSTRYIDDNLPFFSFRIF